MFSLITAAGVFLGDQFLKTKVEKGEWKDGESFFEDAISIKKSENKGFILNKLEDKPKVVLAISSAIFGILLFMFLMTLGKKHRKIKRFGLALAIGGAASNLYDRIKKDGVTDYAVIKGVKGVVVNLGDTAIALGAFFSFIGELFGKDK